MSGVKRNLRQPHAALADLCDGFFADVGFVDACPRLEAHELPAAARHLLVHREHMTLRLAEHYGAAPTLHVLQSTVHPDRYARKITLHVPGRPRPVEFGIVHIRLDPLASAVRDAILAGQTPLGELLIAHGVMRRVSPRWYFQFPADTPIGGLLGPAGGFGRVGTIYCDEEPAIELLEVVACDEDAA
jgi:chorismate-pyruvate lyase